MYLFNPSRSGGVGSGEWRAGSGEWRAESGEWRTESRGWGWGKGKKKRSPKGLRFVVGVGGGVRTHDLQIHNLAL